MIELWRMRPPHAVQLLLIVALVIVLTAIGLAIGDWRISL